MNQKPKIQAANPKIQAPNPNKLDYLKKYLQKKPNLSSNPRNQIKIIDNELDLINNHKSDDDEHDGDNKPIFVETEESMKLNKTEKMQFLIEGKAPHGSQLTKQQAGLLKKAGIWIAIDDKKPNTNEKRRSSVNTDDGKGNGNDGMNEPQQITYKKKQDTSESSSAESSDEDDAGTNANGRLLKKRKRRIRHDSESEEEDETRENGNNDKETKEMKVMRENMRKALGIDDENNNNDPHQHIGDMELKSNASMTIDKDSDLNLVRKESIEKVIQDNKTEFSIKQPKKLDAQERLNKLAEQFRDSQTIYRDKEGRRIDPLIEIETKKQELIKKNEERIKEWGGGAVQLKEAERKKKEIEVIKKEGFAQYELSKHVDKEMMETGRFGDPMAKLIEKEETKQNDSIYRIRLKCKFPGIPNRFGIPPGHRWDGVDRGNGYEKRLLASINARKDMAETANVWSMREL